MRTLTLLLLAAAAMTALAKPLPEDLAYLVPEWSIPLVETPPTIDGRIDDAEWSGAAAGTGLVDFLSRFLVTRNAKVWLTADSNYLYVAMRSPLPGHGELVARQTQNDVRWVFQDDAIEVVIRPHRDSEGEAGFKSLYHMIFNSLDTVYDIKRSKGIGQNFLQWNTTADRANGIHDGYWHWEARFPASDFGFDHIPPETTWRVAVVRNWKNPNAWASITAGYSCGNDGTYIRAKVAQAAPHFQLDELGDLKSGQLRARGRGFGEGLTMTATVQCWPDRKETLAEGSATATGDTALDLDFEPQDSNVLLIDVTDAKGGVVWHHAWQFKPWTEDERAVLAQWNAPPKPRDTFTVQRYHWVTDERLELDLDFDMYVQFGEVAAVNAKLTAGKRTLAEGSAPVADARANLELPIPGLRPGKYQVSVQAVDAAGKAVGEEQTYPFAIKEWEWLGNEIGKKNIILPPYEPITTRPAEADVINRTYSFAPSGLLAQIDNLGVAMLPEAQQLTATIDGQAAALTVVEPFAWASSAAHLAVGRAQIKLGALPVTVTVNLEYDGFAIYTFDLGAAPGVQLDALDMTLALAPDRATLYHVVGERHTDTLAGELPAGNGIVWDSRLPRNMDVLGTFQPYVWYGNEDMGLGWMAESDQGWHSDDEAACIDLHRAADATRLRFHLVNLPTRMDSARTIRFGIMATPAKPLPADWRRWSLWDANSPRQPNRRLSIDFGRFWTHGFGGSFYPAEHDYARVEFPLSKAINRGLNRPVFYTGFGYIALNYPEVQYFKTEWLGKDFTTYSAIDRFADRKIWGDDRQAYITSGAELTDSFMDFAVFYYDRLFKRTAFRGIYYDLFNPRFTARQDLGAYVRDDGKLQKACDLFRKRYFIRRVAVAMQDAGIEPVTIVHITGTAIAPALAFADIGWDAEMRFPPEGSDHMDTWPFDLVRAETMGRQHGFIPFFLQRGDRDLVGMLGAHDILEPRATDELHDYQQVLADFGVAVGNNDVSFHGYWNNAVATGDPDVFCSYYRRPGKAFFLVVNRAEEAKEVTLNIDWNGVRIAPAACTDPQGLAEIAWQPGHRQLRLTVPRHDYRVFVAE